MLGMKFVDQYVHSLEENIRTVKIGEAHHHLDLPMEIEISATEILTRGSICKL